MNYEGIPFRGDTDIPDPSVMTLNDEQMAKYNQHIRQAMADLGRPNLNGPIIRALDQRRMIQAANGGYPKMMYHEIPGVLAQEVYNEDQERVLIERGFTDTYTFQQYPRMLFRRNFTLQRNGEPRFSDFTETKVVKNAAEEAKYLRLEEAPDAASRWTTDATQLPPLPGSEEDKDIQIARLEGELIGVRTSAEPPHKPPQKAQHARQRPPRKRYPPKPQAAPVQPEPAV